MVNAVRGYAENGGGDLRRSLSCIPGCASQWYPALQLYAEEIFSAAALAQGGGEVGA